MKQRYFGHCDQGNCIWNLCWKIYVADMASSPDLVVVNEPTRTGQKTLTDLKAVEITDLASVL